MKDATYSVEFEGYGAYVVAEFDGAHGTSRSYKRDIEQEGPLPTEAILALCAEARADAILKRNDL